ncbi:MAG: Ig-like domain-containing protein [Patescibacteria group bacterium]|mgnify:FL=1
MKKEVLVAVVLGVIVGLIITFGIYTANTALQRRARQTNATPSPTPTAENAKQSSIIIYSPENDMMTDKDTIQLSGLTTPNAIVVIFVNDKPVVTTADSKGNFSADLSLVGGSNVITIVATDEIGKQSQEQRSVVYSTANLDESSASATTSASLLPKLLPSPTPKTTQTPGAQ